MLARPAANHNCRKSLTRPQQHFLHPDRLRDEVAVPSNEIERHTVNFHAQETVGPDIADMPELRLAGSNRNSRCDDAIHSDQFLIISPADRMVLEEKNSFRK